MPHRVEIPEEIEHLDFDPEKNYTHHRHPTIRGLSWCGTPNNGSKYTSANGDSTFGNYSCPKCLRLIEVFGMNWYWDTHRRHFGSNCFTRDGIIYHDCES